LSIGGEGHLLLPAPLRRWVREPDGAGEARELESGVLETLPRLGARGTGACR
jgi:hypothetical protein